MNKKVKVAVNILMFALPWFFRRMIFRRLFKYKIDQTAYIGRSIVLAERLQLKSEAVIKSLNFINEIDDVILEPHAQIDVRNWITGLSKKYAFNFTFDADRECYLKLGEHCRITSQHFLDCTGGIEIGAFTTIAGLRSVFLTHAIDLERNRQRAGGLRIGKYCFVSTNCTMLMNSRLPDYSLLAAGAVLVESHEEPYHMYGGVPAKPIGSIPTSYKYFRRSDGHVN